jgi:hypothetical protein
MEESCDGREYVEDVAGVVDGVFVVLGVVGRPGCRLDLWLSCQ